VTQPHPSHAKPVPPPQRVAVIFDLDGVLTDTAELHYRSWQRLADELQLPFDRHANEAFRGLTREQCLGLFLGPRAAQHSLSEQQALADRKNEYYLAFVERLSPSDLFPGAADLLRALRQHGLLIGLASSSRNAHVVAARIGLRPLLDVIVDGNDVTDSKPDPRVFQTAAQRLDVPPAHCVVVEDAAAGVTAARAAGMRVVGLGPPERVGHAHLVVSELRDLTPTILLRLLAL